MSRIGKQPISVPAGVQISHKGDRVSVKGPKGELSRVLPKGVTFSFDEKQLFVQRAVDEKEVRALHGLVRAHLANMIKGVSEGFTRQLEINGVGYRAEVLGSKLQLALGFSHPVEFLLPAGVQVKSEKGKSTVNSGQDAVWVTVTGCDKDVVGQFVSQIRAQRPGEPYKGKGVKYAGEKLRRKAGKTGAG